MFKRNVGFPKMSNKCQGTGHTSKACRKPKQDKERVMSTTLQGMLLSTADGPTMNAVEGNNRWFLDSGASSSVTGNRGWFVEYTA